MHTFLDCLQKGGKYTAWVASHTSELIREEQIVDKKYYLYLPCKLII